MRVFCSKRAMLLSFALAFVALGARAAYAQQTAPSDAASATPTDQAPATAPAPAAAAASSESADASAPTAAQLNDIPPPPEGKGQVVFYRVSRMVGLLASYSVHEGDKGIGKLNNGSYFVQVTDPGTKEYSIGAGNIWWGARDFLRLEVDEGETYYVVQSINTGGLSGGPNLTPSSEEDFQAKKLKVSTAVPTDRH